MAPRTNTRAAEPATGVTERAQQASSYARFLRAATSPRTKKPYAAKTINNYVETVRTLDRYLTEQEFAYGFEQVDAETLNEFFRAYWEANSQGGTNTRQRNLITFFRYIAETYETANPYDGKDLHRYGPGDPVTPVLADPEVSLLLKVTSGRDYCAVRDNAIIRLFLSGIRLEQMVQLNVEDLDLDRQLAHVVGLKNARGHPVAFGNKTALALDKWLRMRMKNSQAVNGSGPLWLGEKNKGAMTASGIYQLVRRRAVQAGFPKHAIHPHMFRHTKAHVHLADGGSEGDLKVLMGWNPTSTMPFRYGFALAQERALADAKRRKLDDRY